MWGNNHFFRYETTALFVSQRPWRHAVSGPRVEVASSPRRINLPRRKRRDRLKELERASPRESFVEADVETASEASSEQDYSYEFAQMEVIMKTLGNNGTIRSVWG